jgi:PAS domain S-box-containing protein
MASQSNSSLISFKFFSKLCGLIAAALGLVAIVGWLMGWRILTSIRADYIPMAPNTALSFIVLGLSLCSLITERKRGLKLSRIGATVIIVLSLIRFTELSVNINLNVDRWIFQVPEEKLGLIPVGQMALPTALNFLFAGVALFLASFLKKHLSVDALTRVLAGLTTLIGLGFSLGYIYGAPLLYGGTTIPMAINTAIAFFVLGLGLVINNASHDIAERKQAAEAMRKAHDELEVRVAERTAELSKANETLRAEIIERRHAEAALLQSEQHYKHLVESVTNYIYAVEIKDGKPSSTKHGPGCVAVTGYTPEEYEADHDLWYRMVHEGDREAVLEQVDQVLSGHAVPPLEHRIVRKEGSIRWVRNTLVLRYDEEGSLVAYDGLIADITEQKKLEEQLRQAQKMEAIGQLSGGIAHDFNNTLTVIKGFAELLQTKLRVDNPLRAYVDPILESANRAASLTQNLLAFSRKQVVELRPVRVAEVLEGVRAFLSRVLREDIELKTICVDGDLIVQADRVYLEQVLLNLATNARDAMPDGGILTLEARRVEWGSEEARAQGFGGPGAYALFSVSDTGIGMDPATRERIFEPFFTTKEVGKGTGLGLAIVYGIIQQHNGLIRVYSEPGKGTTFKIYLPLSGAVVREIPPSERQLPLGGTETVLVVEDDPQVRNFIRTVLQEYGYQVMEAEDGEEALAKFHAHRERIRLAILDVIMPKRNGREVWEAIHAVAPEIKALFLSGYTADILQRRGVLDEGFHFLSKPPSTLDLLRKVRNVLDQ